MNRVVWFGLMAALAAAGCTRKPSESIPQRKVVREMPVDPSTPLHVAQIDLAKTQLDLAALRSQIAEYRQLNDGKSPPNLAVLGVRLSFPADIVYDAGSGTVMSRTYPAF